MFMMIERRYRHTQVSSIQMHAKQAQKRPHNKADIKFSLQLLSNSIVRVIQRHWRLFSGAVCCSSDQVIVISHTHT